MAASCQAELDVTCKSIIAAQAHAWQTWPCKHRFLWLIVCLAQPYATCDGHLAFWCRSGSGIAHGGLVRILSGEVTVGVDIAPTKHFVWDNEGPAQVCEL